MIDGADFGVTHGANEPRPLRDEALFAVRDLVREFEKRKEELLKSARSFTAAKNRAGAGDIADVVAIAQKVWKRIEGRRDDLTLPYREAADVVRSNVAEFWLEVDEEIRRLTDLVDAFDAEETERIRAQQAEQAAEQERMRAAAGSRTGPMPPAPSAPAAAPQRPIRGTYGGKVVKTAKVEIRVVDVQKVPIEILNSPKVHEAIAAVARDFAKHQKEIDGLEIIRGEKTGIRS